jgi:hypothetical protein
MPPAVDHETRGAADVHPLIRARLPVELAGRQQPIGGEDQQGTNPADNFDRERERTQAASFRST